jgi:hypothetical protein
MMLACSKKPRRAGEDKGIQETRTQKNETGTKSK